MIRIITFLLFMVSVTTVSTMDAQTKKAPCDTEKHNEFNFWVGDWNVYNTQGKLIGTNKILKMQSNCVMQENWESKTSPNKGTSYNYVNLTDGSWNQVWVDNSGYSLVLKGNLIEGKMVLKSELVKGQKGEYYNRVTWTPNKDGSVTQLWEFVSTKGKVIQEAFRGIYKKKN
ncbi:hypothetical protein AAON49_02660 [Pseudotenacibaculum sp. MALMAid0570]|uniref:hypothetical protein n=1 Tax=Pseudotenacibaculum sp. MALMAid0570 TaxID=3143938 RepID=UPI0032DEB172